MNVAKCRLGAACAGLSLITTVLVLQIELHTDSVLAQASADQSFPLRTFERSLTLEKAEYAGGVSVGDLNGDGWPDIVLANGRHWPVHSRVLLNDGHGHFIGSNLSESPARSFCAVLADIDGDGDLDIIMGNDKPDRKTIFKNDGKGKFTPAGSWGEATWPTRFVTVGDLNGDGFPDIVAANAGASAPLPLVYPSF